MQEAAIDLSVGRIGALMRKYAIPCIVSLLAGALYQRLSKRTPSSYMVEMNC